MPKVVINDCFGGFSLSPAAVKRIAEWQGRPCYFFTSQYGKDEQYARTETPDRLFWSAFDIPNPNEVLAYPKARREMTDEQRKTHSALYERHCLDNRPGDRADPLLVRVVEELGEAANGGCAELKVVDIPDGVEWEIDEYDGLETIDEQHRSWR